MLNRFMRASVCVLFCGGQSGYSDDSLLYRVTFDDAQAHYIDVELELQPAEAQTVTLFLPVWTPGSYLVREYAQHIDSVRANSKDGQPLEIRKQSKNEWQVETDSTDPIQVHYRVYCNEMSVRTNFVDAEFAILNGAATFLTCRERMEAQHQVTLEFGNRWQQSVSSMRRSADKPHTFVAESYDELVDSPILVGTPKVYPFEVGGVTHFLVNQGGEDLWNGERAAADVAKIVTEHQRMWDEVPYDRYYFLNLITESGGGLEHDNSTVMMTSRWSFGSPRSYQRWLGLVSHEFFHAWNVRRLRPAALMNYDYLGENYFDELWVAEGVTSYYDSLALARCGLTTRDEYLADLSSQIAGLQTTPGREKQSLVESSHDTWIKFYRPNENSRNTSISYYTKGAVVAFLLDIKIRRASENSRSLDDVMRLLYQRFALEKGFTNQDVKDIASEVAGVDLSEWLDRAIYSTRELEYEPALDWLGLRFQGRPTQAADAEERSGQPNRQTEDSNQSDREKSNKPKNTENAKLHEHHESPWIGVTSSSGAGRLEITRVA
ncbi:MAG: hypothetical protein NXI32_29115, partial [bacterium]|nr:hypothetical protein [bacterium]